MHAAMLCRWVVVGEKVHARWEDVAPGTVRVTMSPAKFGIAGAGRRSPGVDRLADELSALLPPAQ